MARVNVYRLFCIVFCMGVLVHVPKASAQFSGGPRKKTPPTAKPHDVDHKARSGSDALAPFADEAEKVLAPLSGAGTPIDAKTAASTWSIVIVAFTGDQQAQLASLGLEKVRTRAGLVDARLEKRDKATVLLYGSYAGPDSPEAQRDLKRIRSLEIDGSKPFTGAILSPPSPAYLVGSIPEFDLRNAKKLYGKDKALYTLQVAVYGKGDRSPVSASELATFRKAAEEAVVMLRRDGELAFYYHGTDMSIVTVGVFGQDDYDPLNHPGIESPALVGAKQKHPLNLLNGKGIREYFRQKDGSRASRLQPSELVAIPDS